MESKQGWFGRWRGQGFWRELERSFLLLFFLVVALNIVLKLPHLGSNGVFLDEAAAIFHTQGSFGETIDFSLKDPTPPLYYVTLWAWTKCFGISEISVRFPSMLFSAFAAGMIFLLGRRLGNVKVGLFAALFYSFSSLHLDFAQEARAYSMAMCLLMISYYLFAGLFDSEGRSKKHLIALALVNAMLLFTHYSMAFPLVVQGLLALRLLKQNRRTFFSFALADLVAIATIIPWYLANHSKMPAGKVSSWLRAPGFDVIKDTVLLLAGGDVLFGIACFIFGLGIIFVILKWRFVRAEIRMGKYGILIALGLVVFAPSLQLLASHTITPVFGPRYLLYASAGFFLLLSLILALLPGKNWLSMLLFTCFAGFQLFFIELSPLKVEDWKGAVREVKAWENAGTRILICAHYQSIPFTYYYRNDLFQKGRLMDPALFEIGVFQGCDPIIAPAIDSNTVTNIILVLSGEEVVDPENRLYAHLNKLYCVNRKARLRNVDLFQFTTPPCDALNNLQFTWDYEEGRADGDDSMLVEIPDAPSGGKVAFVAPGKDYSVAYSITGKEIMDLHPNRVEIKALVKMEEGDGRFRMVYAMANGADGYDWQAANLDEAFPKGKWVNVKHTFAIPALKTENDVISLYFWAMEGKKAWFDDLSMEFYKE